MRKKYHYMIKSLSWKGCRNAICFLYQIISLFIRDAISIYRREIICSAYRENV